ncbi:MAG: nucleotidyltransferase family protein [Woeseiaceae bacterium]
MPDSEHTVFAVVLAAGTSSRFGATKQIAELDGMSLVQRAHHTATRAFGDRVLTVIGHELNSVLRAMRANSGFVIVNEAYESGMASSIVAAAHACPSQADGLVVLLADQPLVTAEHLQALRRTWSGSDTEIVATAFKQTKGPPVLLPRATFDDLKALAGDQGARALIHDPRFQLKTVPFERAGVDIDTLSDLAALT